MASKLTKAVKTYARQSIRGCFHGRPEKEYGDEDAYIVPAAEYKRLTKVDRLANERAKLAIAMEEMQKPAYWDANGMPVYSLRTQDALRRINELEKQS